MLSLEDALDIFSVESLLELDFPLVNCIFDKHLPPLLSQEEIG